jgi:leucyl aminopeptidase
VDSIKVSAVGGGNIQPGGAVKIDAKVWAYSTTADFVDFFYANDATNPQWQLINTLNPSTTGANDVSSQYTLGNGSVQAVRVVIRYNGSASPCPGGGYDDVDDCK